MLRGLACRGSIQILLAYVVTSRSLLDLQWAMLFTLFIRFHWSSATHLLLIASWYYEVYVANLGYSRLNRTHKCRNIWKSLRFDIPQDFKSLGQFLFVFCILTVSSDTIIKPLVYAFVGMNLILLNLVGAIFIVISTSGRGRARGTSDAR